MSGYAELQVSSNFSFLRGASDPRELVVTAREYGYPAIALTDRNTLSGIVLAHGQLKKDKSSTKFIVGCRLDISDGSSLLCYPTNRYAYSRLTKLLTLGRRRAEKGECILSLADVADHSDNQHFILPFPQVLNEAAIAHIKACTEMFRGRIHLALTHSYRGDDKSWVHTVAEFANSISLPLVATNDVLYHDKERKLLQDVVTCIREKCTLIEAGFRLEANAERHLKPPVEMTELFEAWPDALEATLEIAHCCRFSMDELRYEYPDEIATPGKSAFDDLEERVQRGAEVRYSDGIPPKFQEQIDHELKLVEQREYAPYFLTVHEIVKFAKDQGILYQGRGSAANSVICYCLEITQVDPVARKLLFERFISAARNEPPDIDVDFEHEKREEVIQHIYEKYGRDRAGLTATVVHYRRRRAMNEVRKVFGEPFSEEQKPLLLELTKQLIGFPRHLSQHVGGFVISRGPLDELVPIENARMKDRTVIQWEKNDLDQIGMMKVDVLGLGMLSAIRRAFELLQRHYQKEVNLSSLSSEREDPAVYEMLQKADSIGVFQVESRAQQSMLPRLKPKEFYDLVIEVAIVRPGPIQGNMVHPYLKRREKKEAISYPSKELENVLSKTLGVPLFQEQAMQIAVDGAGFTPDEADQLRRSLATFRHVGTIATFEHRFLQGMRKNGYSDSFAQNCFNQIKGFGTYGFPEAHAISFANLVYVSAWIKCYYPDVFCAALLNSQPMGFYAPAQLVRDAREHGVEIRPIDVNHSNWDATLEPIASSSRYAVRLGLRMVAGLSEKDGKALVAARNSGYSSPIEIANRAGCNRRALDHLANADAFGSIKLPRRKALWQTSALDGRMPPLFRESTGSLFNDPEMDLPSPKPSQEVNADYLATGLSLRDHPLSFLRPRLKIRRAITAAELRKLPNEKSVLVAGLVLFRQHPQTAKETIFLTIEDETGAANLIVWKNVHEKYRQAVYKGKLIACRGTIQREGQVLHVVARYVWDWSDQLKNLDDAPGAAILPARSRDFR